jgi:hypothetical protein
MPCEPGLRHQNEQFVPMNIIHYSLPEALLSFHRSWPIAHYQCRPYTDKYDKVQGCMIFNCECK